MTDQALRAMLDEMLALGRETEWVEFKHNDEDPDDIGEYISALANSACLHEKPEAYLVWGIESQTLRPIGTTFKPYIAKIGNEELENWLSRLLSPGVEFRFYETLYQGVTIVVMVIPATSHTPIQFKGTEYIRVGSYKKKLKDMQEKQKELWRKLSLTAFEKGVARSGASSEDVLRLIDYPTFFSLLGIPLPDSRVGILDRLQEQKVIITRGVDSYDITNLGALSFATKLDDFGRLARKAVRVIVYKGKDRLATQKEQIGAKGYAVGFKGMIDYLNGQLPMNEEIGRALRKEVRMYPEVAIRELAANMIIHQDFSITGAGPMVEIFSDRVEFANPGKPLVDTMRFLDLPPRSRNEDLAALMRRMSFCEERGSGIDKVVFSSEVFQLPAPTFEVRGSTTVATLFAHKKFSQMDKTDRTWACYLHACLRYVSNETMTNSSLRERFKIAPQNYAMVSRVISDTVARGWIRLHDPSSRSRKHAKYVPIWA